MLFEITLRPETPISLKIAVLVLIFLVFFLHAYNPSWLQINRFLATIPLHQFKWESQNYLSSGFNRTASVICSSLAFTLFIFSHFYQGEYGIFKTFELNFTALFIILLLLFTLKLIAMKAFFFLHEDQEIGTLIIDYQFAYNQLLSLLMLVLVCMDIFYFHMNSPIYIGTAIGVGILFLLRLPGTILLLINKLRYPVISLFIYLCAFEIVPMLIAAKVLFVKN